MAADSEYRLPGRETAAEDGSPCQFWLTDWSLGRVAVVWNRQGIMAVYPGTDSANLRAEVAMGFAASEQTGAPGESWQEGLLTLLENPWLTVSLPLVLQGTPFQLQVWRALRQTPAGERISYRALATRLGRPAAARAVARACAANRLALVIPCHRVIRSDGGLAGYRWGTELKRRLLAREAAEGSSL